MNFFCNFETAPVNKVSLIFSSQNHTPLWLLSMLQWLILNCNQTLQVNFLAFYNNLVSQVRDLMRPWNFWKYFSLTNEVYWWNRSQIFLWSVSYTPVSCYIVSGIIDHHHCTRDIPGTRFHLIPFLEVEILVGGRRGCIPLYPLLPIPHVCPRTTQAVCPVMLLSWPAASLKVIFRTTCFAYSVFASKFWNTKMNIPRMYLTASSKWL